MELHLIMDDLKIFDLCSPRVYACADFLLFISNRLNSNAHQHPALQINLSLSGESITVNNGIEKLSGECLLIGTNQPHSISSTCRWQAVLLLSAEHPLVLALAHNYLHDRPMIAVDAKHTNALRTVILTILSTPIRATDTLYSHFAALLQTLPQLLPAAQTNQRIGHVMKQLRQRGNHNLSHAVLADAAALSNSHLSHLFRQETGIALRGYKLWRRTMEGTHLMLQGKSITEASFESGFADTAHFSRSFKQQFGISPSALITHVQEVIWLDGHDLTSDTIL
jgi:AraC-like DNA-binding protein